MNKQQTGVITEEIIQSVTKLVLSTEPSDLVLGIMAPTGSGKSTTLIEGIQRLASEELDSKVIIFVVQPTIIAAMNLYERMNQLYGDTIKIGYAAESNINYTSETDIVYCTGGHMENKMLSYFGEGEPKSGINFCSILIMDEAHRDSLDQDIIVALWKTALVKNVHVPKLMFVSATLDMKNVGFPKAKVVTVKSRSYPVEILWSSVDYAIDSKQLYLNTAAVIFDNHKNTLIKPLSKNPDADGVIWPGYDVWLCFCPGQREVLSLADTLKVLNEEFINSSENNLEIIPIFGSMGSENYMKIFTPPKVGVRRVIISTNLAESSVTIGFVTWVYDTMTEKYTKSTANGGEILTLDSISRSSAKQRAGRTGRVCPGKVTRMCTQEYFNSYAMVDQRLPEIKRVPLHNMIIKILNVGLDPAIVFHGRIEEDSLKTSINTLSFLGMIETSEDKTIVTDMGRFATSFPLSVRGSAILWRWIDGSYPIFAGIVVTCLIDCFDNQSYFFYPYEKNKTIEQQTVSNEEYFKEHFEKYSKDKNSTKNVRRGLTDIEVLIVMWHHLMYAVGSLRPKKSVLKEWCRKNSMNQKKISDCLNTMSKVYGTLNRTTGNAIITTGFSPQLAIEYITPILAIVYSDQICNLSETSTGIKNKLYKNRKTNTFLTLDSRYPLTLNSSLFSKIVALRVREFQVTGSTHKQNFIILSIPIHTPLHIPDAYEIDYSEDEKITSENIDDEVVGDDVEDLFEDELLMAKLPKNVHSNKVIITPNSYMDFFASTAINVSDINTSNTIKITRKISPPRNVPLKKDVPLPTINPKKVIEINPPRTVSPPKIEVEVKSPKVEKKTSKRPTQFLDQATLQEYQKYSE